MELAPKQQKTYRFNCLADESPTHYQLARIMQSAGLQRTRWAWRAQFSNVNLNFAPDLCECLEFKHLLAQLVQAFCPDLMPETYRFDEFSWSTSLSDIGNKYYMTRQGLVDKVEDLAWILKPALLNNGQHIKIFDRLSQIESYLLRPDHLGGPHVLQRYIADPDLYEGRKYSLRFFVVMTQEAGAFLYQQGYLNVALEPYPKADFTQLHAHLTNEHLHHQVSVVQIPSKDIQAYADWYPKIQSMVKTLTDAIELAFPHAFLPQKDRTFAVFGFDFMLDRQQRPWLLEVNHGPCFPIDMHHPLQQPLYDQFWEAMLEQFVLPIATNQPMNLQGCAGFESMRLHGLHE